jgi:hypothetical protein
MIVKKIFCVRIKTKQRSFNDPNAILVINTRRINSDLNK